MKKLSQGKSRKCIKLDKNLDALGSKHKILDFRAHNECANYHWNVKIKKVYNSLFEVLKN